MRNQRPQKPSYLIFDIEYQFYQVFVYDFSSNIFNILVLVNIWLLVLYIHIQIRVSSVIIVILFDKKLEKSTPKSVYF